MGYGQEDDRDLFACEMPFLAGDIDRLETLIVIPRVCEKPAKHLIVRVPEAMHENPRVIGPVMAAAACEIHTRSLFGVGRRAEPTIFNGTISMGAKLCAVVTSLLPRSLALERGSTRSRLTAEPARA